MTFQQFVLKGKVLLADIKQVLPFISAEKKEEIAAKQKVNARTAVRVEMLPDGNELTTYGDGRVVVHHFNSAWLPCSKFGSPNVIHTQPGYTDEKTTNELEGVTFLDTPFGGRGTRIKP